MGVWESGPREDRAAGEEGLRAGTGNLDTDMPQMGMCGRRDFPASYPLPVPLSGMGRLAMEGSFWSRRWSCLF